MYCTVLYFGQNSSERFSCVGALSRCLLSNFSISICSFIPKTSRVRGVGKLSFSYLIERGRDLVYDHLNHG
jgi:hypothetical protein